jgi:D-glycero-beta-D-manno-heptose-7-phosphate kinase
MTEQRLDALLESFKGRTIAILGDLMLDRYYWGTVRRISPEAPVPVVEVEAEQTRFGGAANVANNIQALGGFPVLVGLIGDDHPGRVFMEMIREQNFDSGGIILDASRPTTIKTRVIAQGQHVVRIDNESKTGCPDHLTHRLVDAIKYNIRKIDAIIIEDYNKGVLTKSVIQEVAAVARKYGKIVTVDPKFDNFLEYRGVTVFKPNRREAEESLGRRLRTTEDVEAAGTYLLRELEAANVLITRGEEGMSLFEGNGNVLHMGTVAENVQDVSGAGDTVISTMTMALSSGATMQEACMLANCAGGVVVGAVGIVPIRPDQLREAVKRYLAPPGDNT